MIFVTVGTHEQPFNRLIEYVDKMVGAGKINDKVIIQTGYSTYKVKYCECYDLIAWEEMQKLYKDADVIITHGGPASFIDALVLGKTPIVVPRQFKYNEHVNDHQLEFSKKMKAKGLNIIVVDDINDLLSAINSVKDNESENFKSNNDKFNSDLIQNIKKLF